MSGCQTNVFLLFFVSYVLLAGGDSLSFPPPLGIFVASRSCFGQRTHLQSTKSSVIHLRHFLVKRASVKRWEWCFTSTSNLCIPLPSCPLRPRSVKIGNLVNKMLEVYLAFEDLTDHPHAFSSILHGYFPLLQSCDGCNKLAKNNMSTEKYLAQRDEQVINMDLNASWLVLSMLSPMVFSRRIQFIDQTNADDV